MISLFEIRLLAFQLFDRLGLRNQLFFVVAELVTFGNIGYKSVA